MALPTQKRSKSRKKVKQYKNRLKSKILSICPQCKKPLLSHHACPNCGKYSNREIFQPRADKKKRKEEIKKAKEK
ncbi:MAG: 50S ribosomal protein L32 [Patescibacteria group bacterium]|jgi:large subunit ribosomal protein L32|nr:50S ribosomal protein L32 [Patescibacteria group bacterium]MDD5172596.1 50S ribosomal protein L32 [Patescibacteria group bacterium]